MIEQHGDVRHAVEEKVRPKGPAANLQAAAADTWFICRMALYKPSATASELSIVFGLLFYELYL